VDVTGAGSSFVFPVISKWSQDYSKNSENRINYQSIGSGGGIAQIKAATVDFGASDAPMSAEDLAAAGLGQFPSVIGGIVPIVNVEGVESGKLKLDGPSLAKIFLGEIKKWNDPALVALNPALTLPDTAITVVRPSDRSG
ncbi:extracellular solute-binding protein, partial [Pandoraea sputorum]|uniref:extracellular solute-binding protein n=1 Tax=Pandoraea sputorum TaxID=93222 RepID=UPI0035574D58